MLLYFLKSELKNSDFQNLAPVSALLLLSTCPAPTLLRPYSCFCPAPAPALLLLLPCGCSYPVPARSFPCPLVTVLLLLLTTSCPAPTTSPFPSLLLPACSYPAPAILLPFLALLLLQPCSNPAPSLFLLLPTPVWQPFSSSALYDFFRHGESSLLWKNMIIMIHALDESLFLIKARHRIGLI